MSTEVAEIEKSLRVGLSRLADLTPDDIACMLDTLGCRGVPKEPDQCPVAKYLEDPRIRLLGVFQSAITGRCRNSNQFIYIKTPDSIAKFIRRFDKGYYPDLIQCEENKENDGY